LKNRGLADDTLRNYSYRLKVLSKNVNLDSPQQVLNFIANLKGSNQYKESFVKAYTHYTRFYKINWNRPHYKIEPRLPNVPTSEVIKEFIARASRRYATVFKLLAETGCMPKELHNVTLRDIDFDKGVLSVRGFKGHASRCFKLKQETLAMLKTYVNLYGNKEPLFPNSKAMLKAWCRLRDLLADKLNDSKYKNVRLYDLRHYYATMLYHKTRDILFVKQQMGHRKIETTLVYTQLIDNNEPEYLSAVARTVQEASKLIESGYDYVCDVDGFKLFRKLK
jgi:integrase/recombinase XerD